MVAALGLQADLSREDLLVGVVLPRCQVALELGSRPFVALVVLQRALLVPGVVLDRIPKDLQLRLALTVSVILLQRVLNLRHVLFEGWDSALKQSLQPLVLDVRLTLRLLLFVLILASFNVELGGIHVGIAGRLERVRSRRVLALPLLQGLSLLQHVAYQLFDGHLVRVRLLLRLGFAEVHFSGAGASALHATKATGALHDAAPARGGRVQP